MTHYQPPSIANRERAVLVGVILPETRGDPENRLEELARLADTAGAEVVGTLVQSLEQPRATYFLGRGKAEELAALCAETEADLVLFDHDLTPAQARNLEELTKRTVLDRTQLILDIFARRARTRQAKLQVELAQLQYELPRFRHLWTHLSRIEGGIGFRGPGETQLEVDRRRARARIARLKDSLKDFERQKQIETRTRDAKFALALVGYTNVGKSTLMNALTEAEVFVEDRLFATLDATTRILSLAGHEVLLTDTVGFIRDLPHHLVASFHATLEEVREADWLLHVVDVSHPEMELQIEAVNRVLREVHCETQPTLLVFNKADRLAPGVNVETLTARYGPGVVISARTGWGLAALRARLQEIVEARQVKVDLTLPIGEGKWLAYVEEHGQVLARHYGSDAVQLTALLNPEDAGRVAKFVRAAHR